MIGRRCAIVFVSISIMTFVNVANAGTKLVAPAASTTNALNKLSRRSDVIADVLTIDRGEYLLHLDGSGNGELSGQNLVPDTVGQDRTPSTMRIPFDRIALVYYHTLPVGAESSAPELSYPVKTHYPSIANVGGAEKEMECGDLDGEVARAGAIRWYARQQGAEAFTDHEALVQHGENTALYTGGAVLLTIAFVFSGGGLMAAPALFEKHDVKSDVEYPASTESFRWAVTAADQREVGLLKLKLTRTCPATISPDETTTDLEILSKIEATSAALGAHQITVVEQRDQETQLLDQLDPSPSATVQVASAAALALATGAAKQRNAERLGGASLMSFNQYAVVDVDSSSCSGPTSGWRRPRHATTTTAPIEVRERALTWTYPDTTDVKSLQFKDVQEIRPWVQQRSSGYLPVRFLDGSCKLISLSDSDGPLSSHSRGVQDEVRTIILSRIPQTQDSKDLGSAVASRSIDVPVSTDPSLASAEIATVVSPAF